MIWLYINLTSIRAYAKVENEQLGDKIGYFNRSVYGIDDIQMRTYFLPCRTRSPTAGWLTRQTESFPCCRSLGRGCRLRALVPRLSAIPLGSTSLLCWETVVCTRRRCRSTHSKRRSIMNV
jgi:hypothetical protein